MMNLLPQTKPQECPKQPQIPMQRDHYSSNNTNDMMSNAPSIPLYVSPMLRTNELPITHHIPNPEQLNNTYFVNVFNKVKQANNIHNHTNLARKHYRGEDEGNRQQSKAQDKESRKTDYTYSEGYSLARGPKIIQLQPKVKSYEEVQHARELKSMRTRIKHCKSLQQRKKDYNDPLTHPIYFVRDACKVKQLNMQKYYNKVISEYPQMKPFGKKKDAITFITTHKPSHNSKQNNHFNLYHTQRLKGNTQYNKIKLLPQNQKHLTNNSQMQMTSIQKNWESELPEPIFLQQPQTEVASPTRILKKLIQNKQSKAQIHSQIQYNINTINQHNTNNPKISQSFHIHNKVFIKKPTSTSGTLSLNLPQLNQTSIVKHIIDHNIYKITDMKILYARLCHNYGSKTVDKVWVEVSKWLQSGTSQKTVKKRTKF